MTLVSLTDCCHLLAVDPKTLRRWMGLFQLEALPHPSDARIKCVTLEQVQQLAATHHRTLLEKSGTHFQQEISDPVTPTVVRVPVFSGVVPDFSALISDLTRQLGSLQAHVATLQHQLTHLSGQLQKEQQWRTSQASTTEEKSQQPSKEKSQGSSQEKSQQPSKEKSPGSSREKSQQPSREKSQGSSREKDRAVANTASTDRGRPPHVLPRVEYGAQGKYVIICPEHGLLEFSPDSAEWFTWLSTLSSFRFVGQHGRFTANRNAQHLPRWSWRASRQIRMRSYNHHLGKTESVTIANLEQAAAALQSHLN